MVSSKTSSVPKYPDILTPYHTCPKILNKSFYWLSKNAGLMENSADPDQTPRSAASDLGLHCLLRHVCPNT